MLNTKKSTWMKLISILLCLCFLVSGCSKKKIETEDNIQDNTDKQVETERTDDLNNKEEKEAQEIKEEKYQGNFQLLSLNKEWSQVRIAGVQQPDYSKLSVEPMVKPYVIKKDLSNIENIDRFDGFTDEQKKMLSENGFVVLPGDDTRMHYVYDSNEYLGIPNFITSDSVLHLYHQFYDKSLRYIENEYLYDYLNNLTAQMLDKSVKLIDMLQDEDLKALQEKNIAYFLVARMLMSDTYDININVKANLYSIAKEEFQLIKNAENFKKSPLLGFELDYSQFTVRGHYTKNDELGRYFRTMMWFGTAPLPFFDDDGKIIDDNVYQAMLMTYTTFLDTGYICDAELWNNIYQPTKQYVGVSDDINVFMMNGLRLDVFGNIEDPNIFNDTEYNDKLQKAVAELPEPRIQGKYITVSTPTNKQFRYMGQRYVLDSYIMQELTMPILRPMPTALDTMGVLGSKFAEDLLFNYYKPQADWPEYEEKYHELKTEVAGYGIDTWGENLYNGWLWAIKENLTEYNKDAGMPIFMTNEAWKAKSLNTSLGSYTELKHDTVLYGKQSGAEGGGGVDYNINAHYVEPNIDLYSKLLYLTEYTIQVLRERNMLNDMMEQGATEYQEMLKFLIECSAKELRNQLLTEEEYDRLLGYGALIENISSLFIYSLDDEYDLVDMLVSDIATLATPSKYLSLGTGYFDHIYVVVPVDGKLYLTRGSVYSTYEFASDKRLTDEEWWKLNGITIVREEYSDYPKFTEISEELPDQPEWVKKFKSDVNNIYIEPIEVDWNLMID